MSDAWATEWPELPALTRISPQWNSGTPLRTERERRAALVEIDALVAVWLGLTVDQLITIYLSRFPVLNQYEDAMWFDSVGRRLSPSYHQYGSGQTKEHWDQLQNYLEDTSHASPPPGFAPPFYKADRVTELRQAHAAFSARLAGRTVAAPEGERTPSTVEPVEVIT